MELRSRHEVEVVAARLARSSRARAPVGDHVSMSAQPSPEEKNAMPEPIPSAADHLRKTYADEAEIAAFIAEMRKLERGEIDSDQ